MSLLSHFAVHRLTDRTPPMPTPRGAVNAAQPSSGLPRKADDPAHQLVSDARFLANTVLVDGEVDDVDLARLEAGLDEFVDMWTPAIHTRSRFELVSLLVGSDDAIGEIAVSMGDCGVHGSTAIVEWRATGRFSGPLFLQDDWLIEPTGGVVEASGTFAARFHRGRAVDLRCYYDQLTLLVQMGMAPTRARTAGSDACAEVKFSG